MTKLGDKPVHHNGRGKFHPDHRIRIRCAAQADLLHIQSICTARYHTLYDPYTPPEAMAYFLRPFAYAELRKRRREWKVLCIGNLVEGCMRIKLRPNRVLLDKFYLSGRAAGRRMGARMIMHAASPAVEMRVQVHFPNHSARKFFARHQFKRQGLCRWRFKGLVQTGVQLIRQALPPR